jgi:hypothetical protein
MTHQAAKILQHLLTIAPLVGLTGTDTLAELLGATMDSLPELE